MQSLTALLLAIFVWMTWFKPTTYGLDFIIISVLAMSCLPIFIVIIPFTPFGNKMIDKVEAGNSKTISFLVSNVYQENRKYLKLLELVNKKNPDIIFLLETDHKWMENMESIHETHPFSIKIAQENTYGLLFYSKLEIKNYEINYLTDLQIPSIIADVLFNNRTIRLYGLHPTPPVPQENSQSTDRDAEILIMGKLAKAYNGPCIVLGDLNDVAWSYTTNLFLKISGLLDPRRGRGMFNTFNSKYFLLRWPLDHYFVSSHFRLVNMNVEKSIGSDHFPISIQLILSNEDASEELEATLEDKEIAEEKIAAAND
jgi:endonuclease/exonuclease/phosphatase (EEP) superfamily protein YafD